MTAPGEIRYAHSHDGIDIAYTVLGEKGRPDLVFVPGFVSHLDLIWDLPSFAAMNRRLVEFARVAMFDKRGTGLSDRSLGFGSLEDRMDDIRAVMDSADIEQAAIFGVSEGGPLALLFAATYPERVSKLAIYGTFARAMWAPDYEFGVVPEVVEGFLEFVGAQWGTGRALPFFVHHAPETDNVRQAMARYERNACTRSMAVEILRRNVEIDIRSLLPSVTVPTLVMHTEGDPLVLVENGRYLGEHTPGARYVEHAGDFHVPWHPRDVWMIDEVEGFVTETALGEHEPRMRERVLATVLFTDIVESTERAVEVGDDRWRMLLDRHDAECSEWVRRFGGRLVKTTGDGLLATFDSPSSAVECARAIEESLQALDLPVRAGVHTGEVELRDGDVGGIGVHIGARIAALAGPQEVWVSRTVKDLTSGSGLSFDPRGTHQLKGVPDAWELFCAVA